MTFLANVWIRHIPKHATRFPSSLAAMLSPPVAASALLDFFPAAEVAEQITMRHASDVLARSTWTFLDGFHQFRIKLPRPLMGLTGNASTIHRVPKRREQWRTWARSVTRKTTTKGGTTMKWGKWGKWGGGGRRRRGAKETKKGGDSKKMCLLMCVRCLIPVLYCVKSLT